MKQARVLPRAIAAAAALIVLGACSSLIPPIPVTDLYGVDGLQVDLAHVGADVDVAAGPNVTSFEGTFQTQFDAEGIDLPGFISASVLQESVTIAATVQITVPGEDATTLLDGFTIVGAQVALDIAVDGSSIGTAGGLATFATPLPVSRQSCTYDGTDTVCTYTATVDGDDHSVVVVASSTSAKAIFDALTAGETIDVDGSYAVTLGAPGLTSSAIVRVTLATSNGSIRF
jgi:hypothetical protein